jgi:methyl-accepting chemotaxis protein
MKLDATTKIWVWCAAAGSLVIVISAYYRAIGDIHEWSLIASFAAIVVALFILALKLATVRPRLNLTVAAETIVALGIFSLVISITLGIYGVLTLSSPQMFASDISLEDVRRFVLPFLEGLSTAAVAPLVATFLRNFEASFSFHETGEAGMTETVLAASELAKQLERASANFTKLNEELDRNSDRLQSATASAATGANRLGEVFQTEANRLGHALQRVQAEVTGLSDATERGRGAVSNLTSGMSGLSDSAKDARDLLNALGSLIESVERFVRPEPHNA